MARETEPLLARQSSPSNHLRAEEEEDALITGTAQPKQPFFSSPRWRRIRETLAFLWAFLATVVIIILAVVLQHSWRHPRADHPQPERHAHAPPPGKRNLIFMVSDGMGPSSLSLTRSFKQLVERSTEYNDTLVLDSLLVGQSRTRSSDSHVTDSAAGATAFSCGEKSYNGAISVLPDGSPCPSVMEAAKRAGYMTGVVVTTKLTDATPACFGAHVTTRDQEDEIAVQMLGLRGLGGYDARPMDLVLGGGRCHFLGNSVEGSCRNDSVDATVLAKKEGWNYIDDRAGFDALDGGSKVDFPILGLFAGTDIPFEIDRRDQQDVYPSLPEMVTVALKALSDATRNSEQGFFVMIEGSRIDHAGHINDPAAQVHEVLAYDRAVQAVLDFIDRDSTPTLMISTSDHETGGLALSRELVYGSPVYDWYPQGLANATRSAELTTAQYHAHLLDESRPGSDADLAAFLRRLARDNLGLEATAGEVRALMDMPLYAVFLFADMVSRRALIGWSTHGHTAADVNIFSSVGVGSPVRSQKHAGWELAVRDRIAGNRENTDVGRTLRWWLGVDRELEEVGKELRKGRKGRKKAGLAGASRSVETIGGGMLSASLAAEFEQWRAGGRYWE